MIGPNQGLLGKTTISNKSKKSIKLNSGSIKSSMPSTMQVQLIATKDGREIQRQSALLAKTVIENENKGDEMISSEKIHPQLMINNEKIQKIEESKPTILQNRQVDLSEYINNYFEQNCKKIKNYDEYKDKFVLTINKKIKSQIRNGELYVNNQSKQLKLKDKQGQIIKKLEEQRKLVEIQKYDMLRKLKMIQKQQKQLVHEYIRQPRNKSVELKITQSEDKQKIAQLIKSNRQFEKSLIQKTQLYNQSIIQKKMAQQLLLKKKRQAENQIKKGQIDEKLKQLAIKFQQRKQLLKNSIIKIKQKYIHKQFEKKFNNMQMMNQKQKQQKLKEISEKHKLKINEINQHDRKYTQNIEKRSISLKIIKSQYSKPTKREHTYFRKIIDQQIFQNKEKNYERQMKIKEKEYKNKIQKYQQKIDQEYKPKVSSSWVVPGVSRSFSSVSLSKEERFEKGLQYLAIAKQLKKSQSDITEEPKIQQKYGYAAYKNYLHQDERSNINATEKQYKEILSKQDNDFNKILRAKFLAEGLQAKSKKIGDDKLYFSAKTKLNLLSQLY